jgi:hypothetical protein
MHVQIDEAGQDVGRVILRRIGALAGQVRNSATKS